MINLEEQFSPRVNPADENYPFGSIKDNSSPGANDGTPLAAVWGNDWEGFAQAAMTEAGITPSGLPDTAQDSQLLAAVKVVASGALRPSVIEALRRSYAEAGYKLVNGSFEAGGTLVNSNDVLLQERTGKAYTGPAGDVAAGTNPASGGFVDSSSVLATSLSVVSFGAAGSLSDETAALQRALNAAAGKTLHLEAGKTYRYTTLDVKANTTLITNGAVLSRITASTSHGITINAGVTADTLNIVTPGGAGGDKAVRIVGGNVHIKTLSVVADAEGVHNSQNWAVHIGSPVAGIELKNITIGSIQAVKMSSLMVAEFVRDLFIDQGVAEYYRTAVYLKDVSNSTLENIACRYLGAAVDGRPGENGLLIESSISSGSSHNLTFNNWAVEDAGEHSYRLGGQLSIKNVRFNNCTSRRSGSSILGGRLTSGEWHGGCGFKVLGGNSTTTEHHENIFFNNCGVIDCNITYGTYPAGHGVNNFQPWLIVMAKNVHLDNCWVVKGSQPYAARYGILATATDGLYLDNCSFRGIDLAPLIPYEETPIPGFPGSDGPLTNFYVSGGLFEATTSTPGNGVGLYMQQNAKYHHSNWFLEGVAFNGGAQVARLETASTGSYTNMSLKFSYSGSNVDDNTYTTPVLSGGGSTSVYVDAVAPWRPAASTPSPLNGSKWTSLNDGKIRVRVSGSWDLGGTQTYSVTVADDAVSTIVPPYAGAGHILVTGDGTATHMMGWYRATSSPVSSKYAGAATTAMVNTVLTGTTGTDGNVTIGVQNNLIYLENRNGSTNTFKITFIP